MCEAGSVGDYVNAAGGKSPDADRNRTSVEHASGATATTRRFGDGWWRRPRIEPGAVIRVLEKDSKSGLQKATEALSNVTSQAGAAIMAVLGVRAIVPN